MNNCKKRKLVKPKVFLERIFELGKLGVTKS